MKKPKKAAAFSTPPMNVKGAAMPSGKKKKMQPKMGGLFGSMTAKKPERDNNVRKQHSMRTARLTGKLI